MGFVGRRWVGDGLGGVFRGMVRLRFSFSVICCIAGGGLDAWTLFLYEVPEKEMLRPFGCRSYVAAGQEWCCKG